MSLPEVFAGTEHFRACFDAGLESMLERDGLGVFILVCANAFADAESLARLRPRLEHRFAQLARGQREAGRAGDGMAADGEDLQVWRRLQDIGLDALTLTEYRRAGDWEVQFNRLRSFRPKRMGGPPPAGLYRPFDPDGFSFNRPFMLKEIFWSGVLRGRRAELYYNKYPFVDLHGLLVVERERRAPQFLTEQDHRHVWVLAETLGERLPGLGIGYNALGAFASVNHQHFQLFVRERPLPVTESHWRHNGGGRDYALPCTRFTDPGEAWECLAGLHAREVPYNLLYAPGALYLLPRRRQGECATPAWSTGFSWYELCGGFITSGREDYLALTPGGLEAELSRLAPDGDEKTQRVC